MRLSSDQAALIEPIDGLTGKGSTGGALGTAFAWYMLSPNWISVWTGGNAGNADPYSHLTVTQSNGKPKLRKVAILMSDGVFNTRRGWDNQDQQDASDDAKAVCTAMKAKGYRDLHRRLRPRLAALQRAHDRGRHAEVVRQQPRALLQHARPGRTPERVPRHRGPDLIRVTDALTEEARPARSGRANRVYPWLLVRLDQLVDRRAVEIAVALLDRLFEARLGVFRRLGVNPDSIGKRQRVG